MTDLGTSNQAGVLRARMPELDTVRGIAILGVFLYHALWGLPNTSYFPIRILLKVIWVGHFGVNLFFVLSGFLITGILIDSRDEPAYYSRFYKRRALRILPAYFAVLALLAKSFSLPFLLISLAYLSNLAPIFGIEDGYPVLWSLAVEEQFYLIWPLVCRKFTNKKLILLCFAVVALSPLSRYGSLHLSVLTPGREFEFNEYTWNSLDGLACGALLSTALREYNPTRAKFVRCCYGLILLAIAAWLSMIPWGILSRRTSVGVALQISLVNIAFTGLLGLILFVGSGQRPNWVRIKTLQFFGYISYGWYLNHYCLLVMYNRLIRWPQNIGDGVIKLIAVGLLSVGTAYLSRKYFEEPFLRLKGV